MNTEALVDIVMLVHDQAAWADLAVRAVESFTKNPYRLIIVDSASKEERTKALLEEWKGRGHTVLHLAENRSFSAGVNAGVALGTAKFVCILNDDAIVTEGWDSAMLQDAASKHVGLVGARSNYASGAQGDPAFIGMVPYLVFVCVALRRDVWTMVGPMDEVTFDGFSTEDIDYSWRVRKAGYELKVSNAFVLHAGSRTLSQTVGAYTAPGVATTQARVDNDRKYNARLVEKWGKDWTEANSKLRQTVLLVTYHAEEWTRVSFMGAFAGLKRSDGVSFQYYHQTRAPIHQARTSVADYALDAGFDWLVQLDDDAVFQPDLIRRLISHQKDVVCALAYQRRPPHLPCIFEVGEDGMLGRPLEGIENTGLRKVDVSGFHASIMRTSVIKRLRDFRSEKYPNGIRKYYGGFDNKVGEDFAMCLNLKEAGILVHCDTDLISGHIGDAIVVDGAYVQKFKAGR